ncbi:MAG: hypothetical protein COT43_02160 [Candidatus Marinimicrobia bacterium CG08_land_8_20_14_0_20_45_22]|nr:MAG: hypothetical protein COT43_02160 [Candidatus Marinimicrobia bacterium CG08_land_8_20_14_0_20_45_22]
MRAKPTNLRRRRQSCKRKRIDILKQKQQGEATKINLYDLIPRPLVQSEDGNDGKVTLLQPKFPSRFGRKFLAPRMKNPYFHVKLDILGSSVWKKIDGIKNAGQIADEIESEFGDQYPSLNERISKFFNLLKKAKFIEM